MAASTIAELNQLPQAEKQQIYTRLVPRPLLERFDIPENFLDPQGNSLIALRDDAGSTDVELSVFHQAGFPDPVLYGHLADTLNGQIHILLYILNDPDSTRFDVDRLADGTPTQFGTYRRNVEAEVAAMHFGLVPGQIRKGLRLLASAINGFENFVSSLGHDLYFVEPLYYHNAIIFERYGFRYQQGRRLMEQIDSRFSAGGDLLAKLDSSTPFRQANAANSVRLRSWAIHDGILGEPFTDVTMYKQIGKSAQISTCTGCDW